MSNFFEEKKRKEFLQRISKIYNIPSSFAQQLLSITFSTTFRINSLRKKTTNVLSELQKEGYLFDKLDWCPNAYILRSKTKFELSESRFFIDGDLYIQNASSLIPPLIISPKEGEKILDMCAAPGGKAIHIADISQNRSKLWVNDSVKPRFETLKNLLNKYGVKPYKVTMYKGEELESKIEDKFDKILIDAQCSGEGMINFNRPRALRYWSLIRIKRFSNLQKQFLENAYQLLNSNGIMVYTTCTYAPEENEMVIDYILKQHNDLSVEKIDVNLNNFSYGITCWDGNNFENDVEKCIRVLPTEIMEGFFICKLRKR